MIYAAVEFGVWILIVFLVAANAVSDFLDHLFGGWANFTQGAFGALVGVIGAYGLAAWSGRAAIRREQVRASDELQRERDRNQEQARRDRDKASEEVRRERERNEGEVRRARLRAREEAAVGAAGRMIAALAETPGQIETIERFAHHSGFELAQSHLAEWEAQRGPVTQVIAVDGPLLPRDLESDALGLLQPLSGVLQVDRDPDGYPYHIEAAPEPDLRATRVAVTAFTAQLQKFRRAPADHVWP